MSQTIRKKTRGSIPRVWRGNVNGHKVRSKVVRGSQRMRLAGHYEKKRNVIKYNPRIKNKKAIAVILEHEGTERYRRYHMGESYPTAHRAANVAEKKKAKKLGISDKTVDKISWQTYYASKRSP